MLALNIADSSDSFSHMFLSIHWWDSSMLFCRDDKCTKMYKWCRFNIEINNNYILIVEGSKLYNNNNNNNNSNLCYWFQLEIVALEGRSYMIHVVIIDMCDVAQLHPLH